jgi:hypothetical protein
MQNCPLRQQHLGMDRAKAVDHIGAFSAPVGLRLAAAFHEGYSSTKVLFA